MAAKAQGRPYSIVFVGINGVGKSTSLSKVCYYLKSHGLKVRLQFKCESLGRATHSQKSPRH